MPNHLKTQEKDAKGNWIAIEPKAKTTATRTAHKPTNSNAGEVKKESSAQKPTEEKPKPEARRRERKWLKISSRTKRQKKPCGVHV